MKKVVVFLDDREEKILIQLINYFGGKPPAVVKEALKFRHSKLFPPYKGKNKPGSESNVPVEPEVKTMTQPEACEYFSGKVDMGNLLGKVCLNPIDKNGKTMKIVPLSAFGKETQYGNYTVDDYNVIDEYSI